MSKEGKELGKEDLISSLTLWKLVLQEEGFWKAEDDLALQQIFNLIENPKPRVDEDWIRLKAWEIVERIEGECGLKELQRIGIYHLLTEKGDLRDLLTEADVKIVSGKKSENV